MRLLTIFITLMCIASTSTAQSLDEKAKKLAWTVYQRSGYKFQGETSYIDLRIKLKIDTLINGITIYNIVPPGFVLGDNWNFDLFFALSTSDGSPIIVSELWQLNSWIEKANAPLTNFDKVILYLILTNYFSNSYTHYILVPNRFNIYEKGILLPLMKDRIHLYQTKSKFRRKNMKPNSRKIKMTITSNDSFYFHNKVIFIFKSGRIKYVKMMLAGRIG